MLSALMFFMFFILPQIFTPSGWNFLKMVDFFNVFFDTPQDRLQ